MWFTSRVLACIHKALGSSLITSRKQTLKERFEESLTQTVALFQSGQTQLLSTYCAPAVFSVPTISACPHDSCSNLKSWLHCLTGGCSGSGDISTLSGVTDRTPEENSSVGESLICHSLRGFKGWLLACGRGCLPQGGEARRKQPRIDISFQGMPSDLLPPTRTHLK